MLTDKCVVITGGTGSLGKVLVYRLLSGESANPTLATVTRLAEALEVPVAELLGAGR